uniref:Uncharacterized protein n=1 Tax=Meloidogyne hapla TaxID=6305 RepID=A0A1I8AZF2_MELHA
MTVLGANSANRNSLLMSGPWALNSWSEADPNFLRFGRSDPSGQVTSNEGIKRAAQSANFLRFGKSAPYDPNFLRFGRANNNQQHNKGLVDQSYLRFGRSGAKANNFLRFGRGSEDIPTEAEAFEREYRQSNNPNFLRFG